MKRRRKDYFFPISGTVFLAALAASLVVKKDPSVMILDTKWEVFDTEIDVVSSLENRTNHELRVTVEYLAEHYTIDAYGRAVTFVGKAEVQCLIPAKAVTPVSIGIPTVRKAGPTVQITPRIVEVAEIDSDETKE